MAQGACASTSSFPRSRLVPAADTDPTTNSGSEDRVLGVPFTSGHSEDRRSRAYSGSAGGGSGRPWSRIGPAADTEPASSSSILKPLTGLERSTPCCLWPYP